MKKKTTVFLVLCLFVVSCNKENEILERLDEYMKSREAKGYHFGDDLALPKEVINYADGIEISFGERKISGTRIDDGYYMLGENNITFHIRKKNGGMLYRDATVNVYSRRIPESLGYEIVREYPHDPESFTQGFQIQGDEVYESDGQNGSSRIWKYKLGSITPIVQARQEDEYFSEGATLVGNKVYQLTWKNRVGFIYDKNSLKTISKFSYPSVMEEGWGLTYDGESLIASDGSSRLYFLDPENPTEVKKIISVASNTEAHKNINELEYYKGAIYANVWQKPYILKINPENGEVLAKIDFIQIAKENTKGVDDVLNGIAFRGENMFITGKNWSKIYEIRTEQK
ncbi:MAG: glutaminyl-peptide cyclotransferase [Bergeyella sp.]|nr:glutaminyl-peptide cyclotransferase [Bergeyella sp.]